METAVKKHSCKANGRLTARQIKRRVGEAWALLENPEYTDSVILSEVEGSVRFFDSATLHSE